MPLWDLVATHVIFADDSCSIVFGDDLEQLDDNIKSVVKNREEWYRLAGFIINGKKANSLDSVFHQAQYQSMVSW